MKAVKIKNLNVFYQNTKVLENISFSAEKGDYIGVVGPNGAGKTTLIKAMLGLIASTYDELKIDPAKIGYLQQKISLEDRKFPANVFEIVESGLLSGKNKIKIYTKNDRQKTKDILKLLEIDELKNKLIGNLSGGQLQKVFLARALVNETEILFLDEPTTALDPVSRENFYSLITKLNKEKSITIFLITHDMGTIGKHAKKLLYLDRRIVFYGTFKEFCESRDMTDYFGNTSQHIFCQRHHE